MRLEPLYQRDRQQAKFEGLEQGREEGRQQGREEGEQSLVLRLLNRRVGKIDSSLIERVRGLSIEQLEELGEALLDFSSIADLEAWLNQQTE
jgi:predicted transposase YdaD